MKRSAISAALSLILTTAAVAQAHPFSDPANLRGERIGAGDGRELPVDEGARGLEQMLRKLGTRASLLLIVAHPDDEDGGMLTAYSRGLGARVGTLTLTRGEGGQNAMTGDFEDALGLIRTQELLSADRYFAADQMFGTEVDFGFSKTKEEAFTKWTHECVLYDAVRAVRLYRPLVIAAVFLGGVTDGHGQHQVSGEIAQEVFKAAGDPKVFPELTREGINPWQPLKMYARVPTQSITAEGMFDYATGQYTPARFTDYVTGKTTASVPSIDVTVHEGSVDPLLSGPSEEPRSYVQFARLGLGLQKTQIGTGVRLAAPGAFDVDYHRYGSRLARQPAVETSFFDGVDTSLEGIASLSSAPPATLREGLRKLATSLTAIAKAFSSQQPGAVAGQLAAAQHGLGATIYALEESQFPGKADVLHELRVKQVQLNAALVDALGLRFTAEADTPRPDVSTGVPVSVETRLSVSSGESVGLYSEAVEADSDTKIEHLLAVDAEPAVDVAHPHTERLEAKAKLTAEVTRPYFSRTDIEQPVYQLTDRLLRNAPSTPPALTAWATLRYRETEVRVGRVVSVGEQPLRVVPVLSVAASPHAEIFATEAAHRAVGFDVTVTSSIEALSARLDFSTPGGWKATCPQAKFTLTHAGDAHTVPVTVIPSQANVESAVVTARTVRAFAVDSAPGDGGESAHTDLGYRSVGYGDLPRTNYYTKAAVRLVPASLILPSHRRIGYLPGTGDAVPEALACVGLPFTPLTVGDLTPARLAAFDTVILGVRAYNAHPDLHDAPTQALLAWARNGGNVVVQYQTSEFTGADAPFPLSLGGAEKVVDETAPVNLLAPADQAFRMPNRITATDFGGWIEERGHGFLHTWDPRYTALTEVHDPGQAPQRGGLLTASVGRGHWTYCAFALYRQLPEAVPGAFRIMVNLLGLADPQP